MTTAQIVCLVFAFIFCTFGGSAMGRSEMSIVSISYLLAVVGLVGAFV